MGDYFKVALNYLLLLPIHTKYSHLSFNQLPTKVRNDLLNKTIKFMGEPSGSLFGRSPLELALTGETKLLEDHLKEMTSDNTPEGLKS